MASKRIKGITIEIGADTTELSKAIKDFEKQINSAKSSLRDVDKLLKLDPKNAELLAQKQKYLNEAIDQTGEKLKKEKEALAQLQAGPQTEQTIAQQEALTREIADTEQQLKSLNDEYKKFGSVSQQQAKVAADAMKKTGQQIQNAGQGIYNVGSSMTRNITAPVVAGFGGAAKAAIDWETAFTGVKKTVDGTDAEYEELAEAIMQMSTEMASSKEEIAGVMEIAGQLGVRGVDNLKSFTKTAVMLGDTTNLSAEDAATAFARILNITGDGIDNVGRLGSTVVALGNNFATTESEITEMANRLASAGKISGFTTQEIFAMAAAMSSVGIQAEAGGTAMSQTFKGIQSAISDANIAGATEKDKKNLETLAKVAGMTAEEFSAAWSDKPMQAMQAFIQGLANINEAGGDTFATLDELGMSGIRQSNMLQSLALAAGVMSDATETANSAWKSNSALTDEAAMRYATMQAKLTQLKESFTNLGVTIGERLMPYMDRIIEVVEKLVERFSSMSDEEIDATIKLAAFAASIGPVLMAIGKIVIGIGSFVKAIGAIKGAFAAGGALSSVGATFSGIAASISGLLAPIGLVAAAIAVWVHNWDAIKEAGQLLVERTHEHLETIKADWIAVQEAISAYVSAKWEQIKQNATAFCEALKIVLSAAWEYIKGIFTEKIEFIKGVTEGGFEFILQAVTAKAQGIFESVKTAFENLGKFVEGFIAGAKMWGQHLIENIKGGIESKVGGLKAAVNIAGNIIRERLHFSEPDVGPLSDFNSWMPDMMNQMAQQITQGIPGVAGAVTNAASAIKDGMYATDYSGQLAGINNSVQRLAMAGGDITIPVYIGSTKMGQAVATANQMNTYRSGGR